MGRGLLFAQGLGGDEQCGIVSPMAFADGPVHDGSQGPEGFFGFGGDFVPDGYHDCVHVGSGHFRDWFGEYWFAVVLIATPGTFGGFGSPPLAARSYHLVETFGDYRCRAAGGQYVLAGFPPLPVGEGRSPG